MVIFLAYEAWNRDAVGQIIGECVNRVIDNYSLGEVAAEPVHVLCQHVQVWDGQAVLPVQPMREELVVGIKELNARISIVSLSNMKYQVYYEDEARSF